MFNTLLYSPQKVLSATAIAGTSCAIILFSWMPQSAFADEVVRCGRVYTNRSCPPNLRHPLTGGTYSRAATDPDAIRARLNPQFFGFAPAPPPPANGPRRGTTTTTGPALEQPMQPDVEQLAQQAARLKENTPAIKQREGTVRAQADINRLRSSVEVACASKPPSPREELCRNAMNDLQAAFQLTQQD